MLSWFSLHFPGRGELILFHEGEIFFGGWLLGNVITDNTFIDISKRSHDSQGPMLNPNVIFLHRVMFKRLLFIII